jgi:DNA (cytosine-5)-methyltransferase 1
MLKVLELFSGIGACSKALTNLGIEHEIVDSVEINKYAVQSFNAVHGTNFEPQDITKWDKDIEADLIMHGSPCQDFSVAGKNAGGDKGSGTRSSLMYETLRIVEKVKPKYVIWENVKNLLSKKHRHNFDAYLEAMERLGYHSQYQVLNAKDYGVPQNRERVFTVSIRNDLYVDFKFPEPQELTIRLKDVLEPQVDEKYYLSDEQVSKIKLWEDRQKENGRGFRFNAHDGDEIATTMTTSADRPSTSNYYKDPKEVRVAGKLNHYNYDKMDRIYDTDGSAPTVDTMEGGGRQPKIIARTDDHQKGGVYETNSVSPTLTATTYKQPTQIAEPKLEFVGAIGDKDIVGDGKMLSRNCPQGNRVWSSDGLAASQTATGGGIGGHTGLYMEPTPLQRKVCNEAIAKGLVEPNDAVEYTYSNARLKEIEQGYIKKQNLKDNNVMSTLKCNPQQIGVCVDTSRGGVAIRTANKQGYDMASDGDGVDLSYPQSKTKRGRVGHGVSKTLMGADCMGTIDNYRIRKLTPKECWRLMGFSDDDFDKAKASGVSDSQLYKQAGNSIVVKVLEGILRNLLKDQ